MRSRRRRTGSAWVAATDAWRLTIVEGDPWAGVGDIADRLAGRSLGLVLAGGGARAFAHIGVLRELEEAGYPVNRLAGSSVGAAIAGIFAMSRDGAELEERTYAEFVARNPFNDWTLPTQALTRGVRVHSSVARVTGDAVLDGLSRQLPSSAPTWSAAPGRCIVEGPSWTPPWRPCGCPCSSRRSRPTTAGC